MLNKYHDCGELES